MGLFPAPGIMVALRKESVDRNCEEVFLLRKITMSLSARRAWIEMDVTAKIGLFSSVALRKESVDRNTTRTRTPIGCVYVALRKESVDRNCNQFDLVCRELGRSPQGERG